MSLIRMRRIAAGVALFFLVCPSRLYGHAILLSAQPAAKQVIPGPDVTIQLRFNLRIDGKRSRITLIAPDGGQTSLAVLDQDSPSVLSSGAKGLKRGSYILRWQVLANDGHITRGELPFQVE